MQALTLAALTLATLGAGAFLFQDKKPERFTHPLPKEDKVMERWFATMKPGPAHARLEELLGKYDTVMRVQMEPGKPGLELKGTGEFSWFAEGKWLQYQWSGTMMSGKPGKVLWLLGYDNFKERYVATMIDSMQTCMNAASGHFDQSGDNLILWGTIDEPGTPEQDKYVRYVYRGFGKDKFTFEVHDMMIGESNTKVVEIEHTRKN